MRITLPRGLRRLWIKAMNMVNALPPVCEAISPEFHDEAERRFQLGSLTDSRSFRRDADAIVIAARNRPVLRRVK